MTRVCNRPACRAEFVPRRSSQLYCNAWCQTAHNQSRYKRTDKAKAKRLQMDRAKRERVG